MNDKPNMYGAMPCPKCRSVFRYPTQQGTVVCDDCGLVERNGSAQQMADFYNTEQRPSEETQV